MQVSLRLLCLLMFTLVGNAAFAAWPERPIRMIVPYASPLRTIRPSPVGSCFSNVPINNAG